MKVTKHKVRQQDLPDYVWGSIGGRTTHPADPTGEVFGKIHWPKPQPHERSPFGSRAGGVALPPATGEENATEARETPVKHRYEPAPKPATTTGLETMQDFLDEAVRALGRTDPELNTKIARWFKRRQDGEVGEGMCRMQCNLLIRNAVKRTNK